jgi:RimJ/RimL family protein N-acetyltransferase
MQGQRGRAIELATDRFTIRSLRAGDASGVFADWIADAELMGALNMPPRRFSTADLASFILSHDDHSRYLAGIFTRAGSVLIGVLMIEITHAHQLAKVSGFLGDRSWWGKSVLEEAGQALFGEFFDHRGIAKATAQVWERNYAISVPLRRLGFRFEGLLRDEISIFDGSGRRSQFILGLLASDWKEKAASQKP